MKKYDAIILGSGAAGKHIASEFAKQHKSVAIVEKDLEAFGGACINVSCIPTKALIEFSLRGIPYEEAIERKNKLTAQLKENAYDSLDKKEKVTIFEGEARFKSNNEIEIVSDQDNEVLAGEHIVIDTGSTPIYPPIKGLDKVGNVFTSTSLIEETELPETLIIIGGGYIGLEFASMYASFGSKVKVVNSENELMPQEESRVTKHVQEALEEKGVQFTFGAKAEKVEAKGSDLMVHLADGKKLTGEAILLATGRKPNIKNLQLDHTDIVVDNGAIKVNDRMETDVKNVWAVGDVRGEMQFTYISHDDGRIVNNQIFGDRSYSLKERNNVQYTVFVDPPLSRVGYTKKAAEEAGYEVITNELPVSALPRAKMMGEERGLFTAVVDKKSKKILGVSLFGPRSEELINIVKIAIDHEWLYSDMRDQIFTHPVMSESLNNLFDVEMN